MRIPRFRGFLIISAGRPAPCHSAVPWADHSAVPAARDGARVEDLHDSRPDLRSTQNMSEWPLTACWRLDDQGRTGSVGASPAEVLPVRLTDRETDPEGALADPFSSPARAG